MSSISDADIAFAIDLLSDLGPITNRKMFGGKNLDLDGIQWMLGEVATDLEASKLLYRAAANADRGLPFADASLDLAVSIFGRRPGAELARVLDDDLGQDLALRKDLRRQAQAARLGLAAERDRTEEHERVSIHDAPPSCHSRRWAARKRDTDAS